MKLSTENYSLHRKSNDAIDSIYYDNKKNEITIFAVDPEDSDKPFKTITFNNADNIKLIERSTNGETEEQQLSTDYLRKYGLLANQLVDLVSNPQHNIKLDSEYITHDLEGNKKVLDYYYNKKENQLIIEIDSGDGYDEDSRGNVIEKIKINSDFTANYMAIDFVDTISNFDLTKDKLKDFLESKNIQSEKVRDDMDEIDNSISHFFKNLTEGLKKKRGRKNN